MSARRAARHSIPHPLVSDCSIVGILEQLSPDEPTHGRKVALILHGTLGHKDYLYQRRLAERLPVDSFRFDFRGNHETPGTWNAGALDEDIEDLQAVVAYLTAQLGYEIALVVGHSRGSIIGLRWMCTAPEARAVRGFVNCSGRYRMHKMLERARTLYKDELDARGFYEWKVRVAGRPVVGIIRLEDLQRFAVWDNTLVWVRFPKDTHVLSVHGLEDTVVPPYDATLWGRALADRQPGTHSLCLIEGADHNFTGHRDEVNAAICVWWALCERGEAKTGLWGSGVRPESDLESSTSKL